MDSDERSGRTSRRRAWGGAGAMALGCYLAGDAAHRLHVAVALAADWWPWLLLGLAALNLLRSTVQVGSLIGPLVLALIAFAGLAASGGVARDTVENRIVPCALALAGAGLLFSTSQTTPRTRVLSAGGIDLSDSPAERLVLRAIVGELRADLSGTTHDRAVVHVTAIVGHVRLTVPRNAVIRMYDTGAVLTHIRTASKSSPAPESQVFDVHVLGVCGAVSVVHP